MIVWDQLDQLVEVIASSFGRPNDHIRLLVCMILQTPIGIFMHLFIKNPIQRHLFNIVVGINLQIYMYRWEVVHIFLMAYVSYAIMMLTPRRDQHKYCTTFLVVYMLLQHLNSMITDYGGYHMEVTAHTMLEMTKIWGLTWAFRDGYIPQSQLIEGQSERRVVHLPTIFEYAGFIHLATGCMVGPYLEFIDYKNWIELSGRYRDYPIGSFSTIIPALTRMGQGFLVMGVYLAISIGLGVDIYWAGSKEFLNYGTILHRIGFSWIAMTSQKFMYYSPWCLSDASMIACGLAYNGTEKGTHKWDHIVNIYIVDLEINSSSCIQMMAFWNHTIHQWLKRGVQDRLVTVGKKPTIRETLLTFTVSAVWHGLYPFYYVMFFFCAIIVELSKEIFRSRSLFQFLNSRSSHLVGNVATSICLNYLGVAFTMLSFERGFNFLRATYCLIPAVLTLLLILWKTLGITKMANNKDRQLKQEQAKKQK